MSIRPRLLLSALALTGLLAACAESPVAPRAASGPAFQGGSSRPIDTLAAPGGGGGGGVGGGVGGGSTTPSCGTLSANISTYNIVVYTTRIGIGFSGSAFNCGSRSEAFEVDVQDLATNAACVVNVPHFIAAKNTAPGLTQNWSANSTLVPCMNTTHDFSIRLWDTRTGQTLSTTTVSAFL